ncbi:MAG: GntR family transcriptional regulator [Jannaschia sp.]
MKATNLNEDAQIPPLDIARVSKPKLVRDATVESIRHAIISGHLLPGTRLIERELCETLGSSRASVREAIRQLEADKLVTVTAYRGPAVAILSIEDAREIYELRADLEVRLVKAFCARASEADIAVLNTLFERVRAAAAKDDKFALVDIMGGLVDHMMAVSDQPITSDLLRTLLARISLLRVLSMSRPGRIGESVGEIEMILHALNEGDVRAAERAVRRYVGNAAAAALSQMRDDSSRA